MVLSNVFLHLHPVRIHKSGIRVKFTWCMGGLTFFFFLVETFTGLLLMFYYRPTVAYAYMDIVDLAEQVPLGIMRELHRWGGHAMVISVWLHMLRVFMTGSYKPPREFNWSVGVVLLVLTLLLSFTGYLLPWDQLAIWAITVGSNMARATPLLGHEGPGAALLALGDVPLVHSGSDARFALLGGRFVGEGALLRFYVLHCVGIPLVAAHPDGRPLLAGAEGRRHLAARSREAREAEATVVEALKHTVNFVTAPAVLITLAAVVFFLALRYRAFWKPRVALAVGAGGGGLPGRVPLDPNFALIVKKPDNIPIVAMLFLVGFFVWLAMSQALENDDRIARGEPVREASDGEAEKTSVWPNLVYTEMLAMILVTVVLIVWAIAFKAPIEEPANPARTPNPSKAPWYFLGLQEMLVYFDPWLAGVVFPTLIIVGLMAIPYIDKNPKGNGYYSFRERRVEITIFLFGFLILWVLLLVLGTFLRGPNWNFFGPYEFWDTHKLEALVNVNLSEYFWIRLLNRTLPSDARPRAPGHPARRPLPRGAAGPPRPPRAPAGGPGGRGPEP